MVSLVETESATYNQVTPPGKALLKVVVVVLTATFAVTMVTFLRSGSDPAWLLSLLETVGLDGTAAWLSEALLGEGEGVEINRRVMFVIVTNLGFVVLPVLSITLILREPVRSYGLRLRGHGASWRPYAWLFALSLPFVALASLHPDFRALYPMYPLGQDEAWWPYLWTWWLLYALQFFAVEFLFRGFMVHGLKLKLGFSAVFVMVIPYAMIHFHKPMPEVLGAIVGGTVLGYLSLKNGSIWFGVAIHIAIAGTMDVLALAQTGFLN